MKVIISYQMKPCLLWIELWGNALKIKNLALVLIILLWGSHAAGGDDFFDTMGSALKSVGLPVNEYYPSNSLFIITPRVSNHGLNDIMDFAFIDSTGASSDLPYLAVELQLRIDSLQIVPLDNPLSSTMAKLAIKEVYSGILDSLNSIEAVKVRGYEKQEELGVLRIALAIDKNTSRNESMLAVQGLLTTLLEARQAIYEAYMGVTGGACDNSFQSKLN